MVFKGNKKKLRYGENPNQKAALIFKNKKSIFDHQISGKKISYNNIIDLDSGIKCLNEFYEPTSIIIKHTNACGVASSKNINDAFRKSYESDPKSAFGGIIFLNREVNLNLAKKIKEKFFEMIVSVNFKKDALDLLKTKKNLILIKIPNLKKYTHDYRSTIFGDLYQSVDLTPINKKFLTLVSNKKATLATMEDLVFSLKVVKHLKSNAIALSKDKQTVGLGHGQTNRVDALNFAIKNKNKYFKNKSFVCASDGFFPFTDSIKLLSKKGCKVIAQPNGSINDNKIIEFANNNKISLYFIKNRLFKH
ncbi:MAG: hypothetical protein CL687_00260 [Candidatus Pelagibacter sp.]|nr:hypothetical protein [Candidatus Pelagibacter sp.]|tara:strand:+ start:3215 stop:4132 length:918 start_codon:yes stop_codon:yes gene_type:complete